MRERRLPSQGMEITMITIIGGKGCNYCLMAKDLLEFKGVAHEYIDYKDFPLFKEDGHKTIPQVYYMNDDGKYSMLTEEGYEGLIGIPEGYLKGLQVNDDKGVENVVEERD